MASIPDTFRKQRIREIQIKRVGIASDFTTARFLIQTTVTRFIFATESYGGHYGPAMVTFFDQQNRLIKAGELKGELVTVSALMINKYVIVYSQLCHAH